MSTELPKLTGNIAADASAGAAASHAPGRFLPIQRPGTNPIDIRKRAAGRLMGDAPDGDDAARLRKVTQDFEAVFLSLALKQMRSTIQKDELFSGGMGEDVFTGLLDDELAKKTASVGNTGIAEMLYQQLSRQYLGARDAKPAAGSTGRLPDISQAAGALMRKLHEAGPAAAAGAVPAVPDL